MSLGFADVVAAFELTLAAAGLVLWWRVVLRPGAPTLQRPPVALRWDATIPDFLVFVFFVLGGSIIAASLATVVARSVGLAGDAFTVFTSAFAQLGMLSGVGLYWWRPERGRPSPPESPPNMFITGGVTFLLALPLLLISAKGAEAVLRAFGLPTERQGLIDMFANADSPWLLAIMITLAVVIAPLTEELVFRAGLFRFLRTRIPRWLALGISALLFASLHVHWPTLEGLTSLVPLMVLAIIFSLAYERTGHIGTAIVAHGLFNLNTVVLIFSGVGLD
jgi:membrane protease YdiL (CAAX protease family)